MLLPYAEFDLLARQHLKEIKRIASQAEMARIFNVSVKGYRTVIQSNAAEQDRVGLSRQHLQGWLAMWNKGGVMGGTRLPAPPPRLALVKRDGALHVELAASVAVQKAA